MAYNSWLYSLNQSSPHTVKSPVLLFYIGLCLNMKLQQKKLSADKFVSEVELCSVMQKSRGCGCFTAYNTREILGIWTKVKDPLPENILKPRMVGKSRPHPAVSTIPKSK